MLTAGLIIAWIVCVLVGALVGLLIGWVVWKLGFELIGSAIALVGAGAGGIIAFLAFLSFADRFSERRARSEG
jgi:ABC-type uncharacterized transport system permease subunit